jgi:hypothetical protein
MGKFQMTCKSWNCEIVLGSKSMRCSNVPASPSRFRAMIQPSSTINSSITRPSARVARQIAVYFRLGDPFSTRYFRHSSGRTLASRFRGGVRECMWGMILKRRNQSFTAKHTENAEKNAQLVFLGALGVLAVNKSYNRPLRSRRQDRQGRYTAVSLFDRRSVQIVVSMVIFYNHK